LEDALLAILMLGGQLCEDRLVGGPVFERGSLHVEDSTHQDKNLVVGGHSQTDLSLTSLF